MLSFVRSSQPHPSKQRSWHAVAAVLAVVFAYSQMYSAAKIGDPERRLSELHRFLGQSGLDEEPKGWHLGGVSFHWECFECLKVVAVVVCWTACEDERRRSCEPWQEAHEMGRSWRCRRFGVGSRHFGHWKGVWRYQAGPGDLCALRQEVCWEEETCWVCDA